MPAKINATTTQTTLLDHFKGDAKLLGDVSTFFAFAAAAGSGEPLSIAAGIALILKTAGGAISSGVSVVKRLGKPKSKSEDKLLARFDRFRLLFFVTCQRSYMEALSDALDQSELAKKSTPKKSKKKKDTEAMAQVRDDLEILMANLGEAEVSYLFGVEPLEKEIPLFDAFAQWLMQILAFYGVDPYAAQNIADKCKSEARKRFRVTLAEDDPASKWMRNYLAISYQEEATAQLTGDLASIRVVLENWTDPIAKMVERQRKSWTRYRTTLKGLPDLKETMFNEQFGVREVFQPPQFKYHISGASGDAGKPALISDIGNLFGALISNRTPSEDLIILCGGPGSGKSTLCRVLASELSAKKDVFPIFLRLRRAKEGSEISVFIEEELQKLGLISQISELRDISNLVLILDGFDELVMASRARLRHFFNVLREELSTGPLRQAKAIVSGRDTLFPHGEGLPFGAHVLSLVPFDRRRVTAWGVKWRKQHEKGHGRTFRPEKYLEKESNLAKASPLHHLVTWPLTLHLVARVHTAGKLDVSGKRKDEIEKAYLYRSILAETAKRQTEQTEGQGRLTSEKMREFLRALSWEMYRRSVDSMDPADVIPILTQFVPEGTETDLAELAEVAVVNSPELTKGEDTGFEFVHKSFSEFLVAEHIAACIERVTFKAKDFDSDEPTWRMSEKEAATQLAPVIGARLLTEEVQEMLGPMLGCLKPFLKGGKVQDIVAAGERRNGLSRIISRLESLYRAFLRGESLDTVNAGTREKLLLFSPLEAYSNYCAGLLFIGTAAARQLSASSKAKSEVCFNAEPFEGAFWRCLSLLQAGGLSVDQRVAGRLFRNLSVGTGEEESNISDGDMPWKLKYLSSVRGYRPVIGRSASDLLDVLTAMSTLGQWMVSFGIGMPMGPVGMGQPEFERPRYRNELEEMWDRVFGRGLFEPGSPFSRHMSALQTANICELPSLPESGFAHLFGELQHELIRTNELHSKMRARGEFSREAVSELRSQYERIFEYWRKHSSAPRHSYEEMLHRLMDRFFQHLVRDFERSERAHRRK